ncbi:MAG TPA: hypothetical protein VFM05_07145 [Candidatus Saccharimonadales bacterium]|nr:hypothetical protein [Candidatus Saccharimonadales bacterium]
MQRLVPAIRIACHSRKALATRITKAPFRVITDIDELRANGYQDEGVIVPQLDERESLTKAELAAIAVPWDTPDAMRLVRVPQRTTAFMHALGRSGLAFGSTLGEVTVDGRASFAEAPPGRPNTTINPAIQRYVGLHIDVMAPGQNTDQKLMGIVCGEGGRGLTFCPYITLDRVISSDLRYASRPQDRLERRQQIRDAAAQLQGSVACYTVWLEGSNPEDERTYEAYVNFEPLNIPHDGTTYLSRVSAPVHLLHTGPIGPESFESIV